MKIGDLRLTPLRTFHCLCNKGENEEKTGRLMLKTRQDDCGVGCFNNPIDSQYNAN